jgi:hypothetical protein
VLNNKLGYLLFASNAIVVGGGGLLESHGKLSLLSAVLGMGLGILFLWLVELTRGKPKRDIQNDADAEAK